MLKIHIKETELYDESTGRFITVPTCDVDLEHSLYSMYQWEQRYHKAFLGPDIKKDGIQSDEEMYYYMECMSDHKCPAMYFRAVDRLSFDLIGAYIKDPHTATHPRKQVGGKPNREIMTAEILYSQMIELNVPFECQYWHLNSLLMLLEVTGRRQTPPDKRKKASKSELASRYAAMNEARLKGGLKG